MITSEGDRHLLEIVYGLPPWILDEIDSTYVPSDLKEYNRIQSEWIAEEKWLVGSKNGRSPTQGEQLADMEHEQLARRFRVYYALAHPAAVRRTA